MAVKFSIIGIGWKPQYLSNLKKLIHDVQVIVTHTYSFIRYIFIQEPNLNLEEYAVQSFYKVFLSLLDPQTITEFNNYRLWNRDLAAILNFRNIVFSLRATSQVFPEAKSR
ncbi:hypothetical protein HPULCUR_009845 [Helicostylum pulchrum]|uniref:Uncharacterized protein n=1 Tax=Helicostylum pulchrum TaxID=562976 RepID=A0ABP9YBM8_9FUNG